MSRTWTVIGGGPCGIASVARLLDLNIKVNWIDPSFKCGRMGKYYKNVPANTTNADLLTAMNLCRSLEFKKHQDRKEHNKQLVMRNLEPSKCYELGVLVDVLEDSTSDLVQNVNIINGWATKVTYNSTVKKWKVNVAIKSHENDQKDSRSLICESDAIIYVCGGVPIEITDSNDKFITHDSYSAGVGTIEGSVYDIKSADIDASLSQHTSLTSIDHSTNPRTNCTDNHYVIHNHNMDLLVNPIYCNQLIQSLGVDAVWAVIGSSHSAMLIVKNLFEAGVKNIYNVMRSDEYRFMYVTDDGWTRYQGIGLKGPVGDWVKGHCLDNNSSSDNSDDNRRIHKIKYIDTLGWYDQLVPHKITHCVAAIGFIRDDSGLPEIDVIQAGDSSSTVALSRSVIISAMDQYDKMTGEIVIPDKYLSSSSSESRLLEVKTPLSIDKSQLSDSESRLSSGLFGGGIAFPQDLEDGGGNKEPWVGFKRSIEQVDLMVERFYG